MQCALPAKPDSCTMTPGPSVFVAENAAGGNRRSSAWPRDSTNPCPVSATLFVPRKTVLYVHSSVVIIILVFLTFLYNMHTYVNQVIVKMSNH